MRRFFYIHKRALAWLRHIGQLARYALWPARQRVRSPAALIYPDLHKASQRFAAWRPRLSGRAAPRCPARFYFGPYAHGPPRGKS